MQNQEIVKIIENLKGRRDYEEKRASKLGFASLYEYFEDGRSIATAVLLIADYQYKAAFVADQEINLLACLTQMMGECKFK